MTATAGITENKLIVLEKTSKVDRALMSYALCCECGLFGFVNHK